MDKKEKPKENDHRAGTMDTVNQGLNLVAQVVNNATGIDKGNDGKPNNKDD